MHLHCIDGSPFARIARVLILEHGLPVRLHEITAFPPPDDFLAVSPLGHVSALQVGDKTYFPTRIVIDALLTHATELGEFTTRVNRPGHALDDEQSSPSS
jgi:glutathione S-transferase